ncbi:MAG: TRCF domain-containing protein, partial [Thermodesulfobacteriota bacterium]
RSPKEQKDVVKRLAGGGVDILIATHRLLQKDVVFNDLGLVIVDEEQRFGVSHKEKLKKMRKLVDTLTLTATPIPRTFHMSIVGVRDLSIIDTPPEDRLSIKTLVSRFDDRVIKSAVIRELDRGGQIFFVHNRVQSIDGIYNYLKGLLPEVRICVAHGQMKERDLEKVMNSFISKEYDMLISTSIIESGLDIPSANTIIINRADRFGLAQLYQLRGRVGRSSHRAYAYLLVPQEAGLTRDAKKRLRVLKDLTELGSGFKIASYDLEIRGAGDLLGTAQSGQIARVGFDMYTKLLEQAVKELKGEEYEEEIDVEMKVPIPSYIPEEYIPDNRQRLTMYKRLASAESASDIDEMKVEVLDRYGEIPDKVENLFDLMKTRCMAKGLKIKVVTLKGNRLILTFHEKTKVSPDTIIGMVAKDPKRFHLSPDHKLTVILKGQDRLLEAIEKVLQNLQ